MLYLVAISKECCHYRSPKRDVLTLTPLAYRTARTIRSTFFKIKGKVTAIPLQAWTVPYGSRRL
jgi:hypothetical protein